MDWAAAGRLQLIEQRRDLRPIAQIQLHGHELARFEGRQVPNGNKLIALIVGDAAEARTKF